MRTQSSPRRREILAVILTEARDAANGDETAIATVLQAAHELKDFARAMACPRLTRSQGELLPRYRAAMEALSPAPKVDYIGRAVQALDAATAQRSRQVFR